MSSEKRRSGGDDTDASAKRNAGNLRDRVMQGVLAKLERGRSTQAVKLFRNAQDHDLFPTGSGLHRWLNKSIGKEATAKLIDAFVRFPCFYCKHGLESCEVCDGRGTISGAILCEACAGLGVARCGFCDGSGWVTNNIVPPGLRVVVLAERVSRARKHLEVTLSKPISKGMPSDPVQAAKRCAKQILHVNRQLGVFENTIVTTRKVVESHPRSKEKLAKIIGVCCRGTLAGQERVRELAQRMSDYSKEIAESVNVDETIRERAASGAAYYESLAKSATFAGTSLDHPYLRRTLRKLARQRSKAK
ncbi:MAG: hypothetical protein JXO22_09695 [Phycisphaerae bacterium]|nr:hypothetical protein [Phycisphaerae bacterium]